MHTFACMDLFSVYPKDLHSPHRAGSRGIREKKHFGKSINATVLINQKCFSNTYYLPSTMLEIKGRRLNEMEALPLSCSRREQRDWSISEQWDAHRKEDMCEKKLQHRKSHLPYKSRKGSKVQGPGRGKTLRVSNAGRGV